MRLVRGQDGVRAGRKLRLVILGLLILVGLSLLGIGGGYEYWNQAPPERTCASCHEIAASYHTWAGSPHQNVHCIDCHGTALSAGWHSLTERVSMALTHFTQDVHSQDITLTEQQLLEMSERCASCHQAEHAGWLHGGHAATYADIFLDETHNREEKPYPDCLHCHGMFFDGTIGDLVQPLDRKGPWTLKRPGWSNKPTIPCLACHKIHCAEPPTRFSDDLTGGGTGNLAQRAPHPFVFFDRNTQLHLSGELTTMPVFLDGDRPVKISADPRQHLCIQCHAPDPFHQVGTSDDRTPKGVHEGLSCLACHEAHSGRTTHSCANCHPAMSKCGLDVEQMDTTYYRADSHHNIHFVKCQDCHDEEVPEDGLPSR